MVPAIETRKRKYEIRRLNAREGQTVHETWQASDGAATERALCLAEGADAVEVWRDMACVYSSGGPARSIPKMPGSLPLRLDQQMAGDRR